MIRIRFYEIFWICHNRTFQLQKHVQARKASAYYGLTSTDSIGRRGPIRFYPGKATIPRAVSSCHKEFCALPVHRCRSAGA